MNSRLAPRDLGLILAVVALLGFSSRMCAVFGHVNDARHCPHKVSPLEQRAMPGVVAAAERRVLKSFGRCSFHMMRLS